MITTFYRLDEALRFVVQHGGPVREIQGLVPGVKREPYADDQSDAFVLLADGALFGCVAEHTGPLSEVTPDEATYVYWVGIIPTIQDSLAYGIEGPDQCAAFRDFHGVNRQCLLKAGHRGAHRTVASGGDAWWT